MRHVEYSAMTRCSVKTQGTMKRSSVLVFSDKNIFVVVYLFCRRSREELRSGWVAGCVSAHIA